MNPGSAAFLVSTRGEKHSRRWWTSAIAEVHSLALALYAVHGLRSFLAALLSRQNIIVVIATFDVKMSEEEFRDFDEELSEGDPEEGEVGTHCV